MISYISFYFFLIPKMSFSVDQRYVRHISLGDFSGDWHSCDKLL